MIARPWLYLHYYISRSILNTDIMDDEGIAVRLLKYVYMKQLLIFFFLFRTYAFRLSAYISIGSRRLGRSLIWISLYVVFTDRPRI